MYYDVWGEWRLYDALGPHGTWALGQEGNRSRANYEVIT